VKPVKALGYIRISKEDKNSISLDYQQAEIEKLCRQEGLELVHVETEDRAISGEHIKTRPAVQRVLQAVDNQDVDAVVVYKSDRISRDGIECLQIEKLMIRRGVDYFSVTEGNLTADSVDDEFMRYVRAGLNQRERKLVSLRTRQALQRKRERGEKCGGHTPYGYEAVRLEGKRVRLRKDLKEQRVIARMKRFREEGLSYHKIATWLNEQGIITRTGAAWSHVQVSRLCQEG